VELTYTAEDEAFRAEIFRTELRAWLHDHLTGEFAEAKGLGGPGREHEAFDVRLKWDRNLAAHGWTCLDWPAEYGGRAAGVAQQVIFHEEYARADAPIRVSHIGEQLLGPTLIAFGTEEQKQRFLPGIRTVTELWCQGYSEPGAGSDLANVKTTAVLSEDGTEWILNGQKVWTSLAHLADWCFVVARTDPADPAKPKHRGLSYLLVPMKQPGVEVRPILQLTKTSEFNEVYFTDARTDAANVVGGVDDGWRVAMATLGFERGVSTLGQQIGFRRELDGIVVHAKNTGAIDDPLILDRLTRASIGLDVLRLNALRSMTGLADSAQGAPGPEASIAKLAWARWHRDLGELAMDVRGVAGTVTGPDYDLDEWQRLWLFSRADTIYGGSDEIQRNVIAERVLGLPKEPRA
jgi:alkylation response protein AidB-like acyl-CoA dehydrogenase